jgi:hypothetical protein
MEMSAVEHKWSSIFRILFSRYINSLVDIFEVPLYMPFGTVIKKHIFDTQEKYNLYVFDSSLDAIIFKSHKAQGDIVK